MPIDDPAFSKPIRILRRDRWYIAKTVGEAIDFVNDTIEEPERERPHWGQARHALYAAFPDDATGMPRPGPDKIVAAEESFRAAAKKERWLV